MPELPEVEAVCRKLRRDAAGATIVRALLMRKRDPRLEGHCRNRRLIGIERRGKNALLHLDGGWSLRVHLRMTGNLYVIPDVRFRVATVRACFELDGGRGLVFDDPRALGVIELHRTAELSSVLGALGPEPLSAGFTPAWFEAAARASRQPVKLFLLDQRRIAGLGNIYAAEALHRARIHPTLPVNRLGPRRLARLHRAIVDVLTLAVQSACDAYDGPGSYDSDENFPVAVYGREGLPCPVCRRRVRRIPQGGRSTYFCPGCQR